MAKKNRTKKTLVLLDAHAIIHRAYHALPDFASTKGEPTGALYGLAAMLIKTIKDLEPDYLVACYDLPEPTHRHDVYDGYKATRAKTDDELAVQIDRSRDVLTAFHIPIYEAAGFEADDVLGTIVSDLKGRKDIDIIIASGDHDTLQLVDNDHVRVFTLRKGLSDTVLYNEDAVRNRFSFGPEYIADYKGLRGDASDNIPGIRGIGEKTATELITTFGTVEEIYKTLKKDPDVFTEKGIKPRTVKLLTEGEDDAVFSKMLATIRSDAPISFTLPENGWRESVQLDETLALFDELGFRSLSERMKALLKSDAGETAEHTDTEEAPPREQLDEQRVGETAIALWLLHSDITNPTLDDILRFAGTDDFETAREHIFTTLQNTGELASVFETIERPLMPVVSRMQETGVSLNTEHLKELSAEYHAELDKISARIHAHAGGEFNINSPKQLSGVIFDELGLSAPRQKKTETGQRSTRESELEKMRGMHPIIGDVLQYRELQKLLSTYIDALPKFVGTDGRLHAEFLQAGTTTGRMSSQNPNLQNIPIKGDYGQRIRHAFTATDGYLLAALDYSQIELRIAAGLSGDEKLVSVFQEQGDVHSAVAAEVFGVPPEYVDREMRRRAKVINFGILYGMGVNALRGALGAEVTRDEAQKFLNDYFKNFAGLAHYIERVKLDAARQGYTETLFGRRRTFAGFSSPLPQVRAQAERMAINAPIQGTQADIIKIAMVRIHERLKERDELGKAQMVLQIHDELVFEVAQADAAELIHDMQEIMETIVAPERLSGVPLVVDAKQGENWGEMFALGSSE